MSMSKPYNYVNFDRSQMNREELRNESFSEKQFVYLFFGVITGIVLFIIILVVFIKYKCVCNCYTSSISSLTSEKECEIQDNQDEEECFDQRIINMDNKTSIKEREPSSEDLILMNFDEDRNHKEVFPTVKFVIDQYKPRKTKLSSEDFILMEFDESNKNICKEHRPSVKFLIGQYEPRKPTKKYKMTRV